MPQGDEEWYREFEQSHELPQGYDNWDEFWETARDFAKSTAEDIDEPGRSKPLNQGAYLKKWAERQAERQTGYKETHDDMRREIRKSGKGGESWEDQEKRRSQGSKDDMDRRYWERTQRQKKGTQGDWERQEREREESNRRQLDEDYEDGMTGMSGGGGLDEGPEEDRLRLLEDGRLGELLDEIEAQGAASLSPEEFIEQVMSEAAQSGGEVSADEIFDKYFEEFVGDPMGGPGSVNPTVEEQEVGPGSYDPDKVDPQGSTGPDPGNIGNPWAGYTREDDARDRKAANLPPNDASEEDWARHKETSDTWSGARQNDGSKKPSDGYRGDALRDAARGAQSKLPSSGFLKDYLSMVPDIPNIQEVGDELLKRQGPDIQPMNQREKDAQAIKAESAAKMGDIRADEEYHDHLDRTMEDRGARAREKEDRSARTREKWGNPQRAYDEGDFDPEDWGLGDEDDDPEDQGEKPSGQRFMVRDEHGVKDPGWNDADEKNWQDYESDDSHGSDASKYDYDNPFEEKPGQPGQDEQTPMEALERNEPYEEREAPKKKPIGFLKNSLSKAEKAGRNEQARLERSGKTDKMRHGGADPVVRPAVLPPEFDYWEDYDAASKAKKAGNKEKDRLQGKKTRRQGRRR